MAIYEIKNYVKLLCINVDHFETYVHDEKNTDRIEEIEEFISKYRDLDSHKIIMIQMNDMKMFTYEEIRRFIKHLHVFDYVKHLCREGNKLIAYDSKDELKILDFLEYLLLEDETK